jgi:sarcosine oxidase subunit beta
VTVKGAQVVIVGGGVTGLSAGWWLARQGAEVLVLEKFIVGWEASGRNGGGASHSFSPLFLEEQRLWPQMDELLGYPTEFQPCRVRIGLTDENMTMFRRQMAIAARQGFKAELLTPQQVRELVPLAGDNVIGGAFYHYGGHANPQRTVQAYAWALQDLGGRILQHCRVTGFRSQGGRVAAVVTDRGEFGCDSLVIAAGPQLGELAGQLGAEVPVAPARAEMIVTEPLPLMKHGGTDGNALYGRQTLRGNLVFGGGPHEWLDEAPVGARPATTPLTRNLAGRLLELFPKAAHVRVIRSWAGIVENTPDGRPILDRLKTVPNTVVATMSSIGFGLSPASGRAIADLVLQGRCDFADLTSCRLDRFANLDPDWRQDRSWISPDARASSVGSPLRTSQP